MFCDYQNCLTPCYSWAWLVPMFFLLIVFFVIGLPPALAFTFSIFTPKL